MEEIADQVGITRQYYGMIESGKRTPALGIAIRIAESFSVPVEEVFFDLVSHDTLPPRIEASTF